MHDIPPNGCKNTILYFIVVAEIDINLGSPDKRVNNDFKVEELFTFVRGET